VTNRLNVLLTGVAALALLTGAGLALAQESPEQHGSKAPATSAGPAKANDAAQEEGKGIKTNRNAQEQNKGGKISPSAQEEKKGAKPDRSAQEENKSGKMGPSAQESNKENNKEINKGTGNKAEQPSTRENRAQSQERERSGQPGAATANEQQRQGGNGAAGNAAAGKAGTNVSLTEQQRTRIRQTVIDGPNVPRVANVNFNVQVGTVVPRGSIHVVPVPEMLVEIQPAWRGYLYFVYEDEVIIVDPDMTIVAVVEV
jgi:hypothetical protein